MEETVEWAVPHTKLTMAAGMVTFLMISLSLLAEDQDYSKRNL